MEIIYKTIVGSQMHGLATPDSDEDVRYITLQSVRSIITPFKKDDVKVNTNGEDVESWELRNFVKYLCSGNPTIYEVIKSPLYDREFAHAETVRSFMPFAFDARKVLMAHAGYAEAQLKRYLQPALKDFEAFMWNGATPAILDKSIQLLGIKKYDHEKDKGHGYPTPKQNGLWEDNHLRRIKKATIAAHRVLAQAKQLLTTGDFSPVISDYSRELHDKLMEIKLMSNADITFSFVENHSNSITGLIQDMHILFESLDDSVKNATPKIEIIEQKLFSIYNVNYL